MKNEISHVDKKHFEIIRNNVSNFIRECSLTYDTKERLVLDIAPQVHKCAKDHFKNAKIETLDIDPDSSADYIADICNKNDKIIEDCRFDIVICTEVLEHTLNPFKAVEEIYRILKPNGIVYLSTPFNFRIHGPLPDCWRFTEHGLNALFLRFIDVKIESLETPDRFLMPIHYTLTAKKL